ncbi:hypothetical protein K438DRAFT_1797302 [Mycena galopus ATCC 62051]|nr:hypothetical protein K438DRAFT_1797302 [Mycena galopus ATCC 62051]
MMIIATAWLITPGTSMRTAANARKHANILMSARTNRILYRLQSKKHWQLPCGVDGMRRLNKDIDVAKHGQHRCNEFFGILWSVPGLYPLKCASN